MFLNNLKVTLRAMLRHKVFSLINILGLAIGMAACILILLYVNDELSYDRYHDQSDRIYRVSRQWLNADGASNLHLGHVAPPFGPLIKEDFEGIAEEVVRFMSGYNPLMTYAEEGSEIRKQFVEERFFFADPEIFKVFSWEMISGDPETALIQPNGLVITQSCALKYFGDTDPMGKVINFNQELDMQVTGVLADPPSQSHFGFDMLGAFAPVEEYYGGKENLMQAFGSNNFATYILLPEGYDPEALAAQIPAFIDRHLGDNNGVPASETNLLHLWPLTDIHLYSHLDSEVEANSDISFVYIASIIALFILLIACMNFINLSTAQSSKRAKEVGLRKVIGANRIMLIRQFITESMVISLIALAFSSLFVILALPHFNQFLDRDLSFDLINGRFTWPMLLGIAVVSGLIAGSYPALYLSSFKPVRILRGVHKVSGKKSPLRAVLVIMQFSISIMLVIGMGVVQSQLNFVKSKSLGFQKENLLVLPANDQMHEQYAMIKARLLSQPGISDVSLSSRVPSGRLLDSQGGSYEMNGDMKNLDFRIADIHVDHDYLKTLGVKLKAGRHFDLRLATDSSEAFILNDIAIKQLGYEQAENALGKKFNYGGRRGQIIGVTEDFHFESLHQSISPMVFVITQGRSRAICLRIHPAQQEEVLAYVEKEWAELRPGFPFTYNYISDQFDEQYREEDKLATMVTGFSILAILIAALGLFGLASFTAEQRFREIGIRRVLGASVGSVMVLLTRNFTLLVLIGFLIAIPSAWLLMDYWLEGFAYHIDAAPYSLPLPYLISGISAIAIAWFTISWQSYKAASSNPVEAIRSE